MTFQINPRAVELALYLRDHSDNYKDQLEELEALWGTVKERYPLLTFDKRFDNMTGPGWWPILEMLFSQLSLIVEAGYPVKITQIKEKFGGLRVYVSSNKESAGAVHDAISDAAHRATGACYFCGESATLRTDRAWIATLCDEHNTPNC